MADPPGNWQLFPTAEYGTFSAPSAQDDRLAFSLLMCLSAQHRFTGAFRLCVYGGGELSVMIPIEDILYPTPPEFSHLSLLFAISPREVILQPNSMASAWVDLVDMLREKSALIVNGDEEAEEHTKLVEHLLDPASKKANLGASLRWMVAARADAVLILELQMLPVPARMLNKQNLRQDNAVCVLLKHFRVRSNMFRSEDASGPVPLLFVPDRPAAEAALRANPVDLLEDIKTLNERFLVVEHLTLRDAVAYMQSRHRAAKGFPVFPATVPAAPAAKRARTQTRDDASTGTF